MHKIIVIVYCFGKESEQLEFSSEEAFKAFETGWEFGALLVENGAYKRLPENKVIAETET